MLFTESPLAGVYVVEQEPHEDNRGFFARMFCCDEFAAHGLAASFAQVNNSHSVRKGTLRGLHYQLAPKQEAKLIRCVSGAIYDVALDLRPGSHTFGRWFAAELTGSNRRMLYVPKGCAHGFLTLDSESEVIYLVSESYSPDLERGVRWNDPAFGVEWPFQPEVMSDRDRAYPDFGATSSQ